LKLLLRGQESTRRYPRHNNASAPTSPQARGFFPLFSKDSLSHFRLFPFPSLFRSISIRRWIDLSPTLVWTRHFHGLWRASAASKLALSRDPLAGIRIWEILYSYLFSGFASGVAFPECAFSELASIPVSSSLGTSCAVAVIAVAAALSSSTFSAAASLFWASVSFLNASFSLFNASFCLTSWVYSPFYMKSSFASLAILSTVFAGMPSIE